jgi:hypothetical protein
MPIPGMRVTVWVSPKLGLWSSALNQVEGVLKQYLTLLDSSLFMVF